MSPLEANAHNHYLIPVGKEDHVRATALNSIFDAHSLNFFPFNEIKDNGKILFVGCGNGRLVVEIAKKIALLNIKASLIAIDISTQQIDCAQTYAFSQEIYNIVWLKKDIHALDDFKGLFNIVHTRFVLNHLKDAKSATKKLCEALTDDGRLVVEELDGVDVEITSNSQPFIDTIEAWKQMILLQHAKQESDIAFASKIPKILRKIHMEIDLVLKPQPKANSAFQKNLLPESMVAAQKILANLYWTAIPTITTGLNLIKDSEDISLVFKCFCQIQAKREKNEELRWS